MVTLDYDQLHELSSLIGRLVDLTGGETSYTLCGAPIAASRTYREMQHVAARIRALGIPFHDIPDSDD